MEFVIMLCFVFDWFMSLFLCLFDMEERGEPSFLTKCFLGSCLVIPAIFILAWWLER